MKVEIYSHNLNDKTTRLCATWTLDKNSHAVCDDESRQKFKEIHGVPGVPYQGRMYDPKDGEKFLRNLPWDYASCSTAYARIVE